LAFNIAFNEVIALNEKRKKKKEKKKKKEQENGYLNERFHCTKGSG